MADVFSLESQPIHLGLGALATAQPAFTGMAWYESYAARTAADGIEGRLVSMHRFTHSWDSWEMHPVGEEVVLCTEGSITLIQEFQDGRLDSVTLQAGEYAINPPGVWHTADLSGAACALFITAGTGTEARAR